MILMNWEGKAKSQKPVQTMTFEVENSETEIINICKITKEDCSLYIT